MVQEPVVVLSVPWYFGAVHIDPSAGIAMATARKASAYVQFKVRFKESTRAEAERAAKRRRVSLNAEIVDRIESGTLMNVLSEGKFGLNDLKRFADYVEAIKLAVRAAGEDEETWLSYARHVPFPIDLMPPPEVKTVIAKAIAAADAEDRAFVQSYVEKYGRAPDEGEMVRMADGLSKDEINPAAEYRWRARRISRREEATRKS